MSDKLPLKDICNAVINAYGQKTTANTLMNIQSAGGRTHKEMRGLAMILSQQAGYSNKELSDAFSFSGTKAVSASLSRAKAQIDNDMGHKDRVLRAVSEQLGIDLG